MSNLGGNSLSEETDRSNNLQGDPGADGTDGTNGTNGTNGTDGTDGEDGTGSGIVLSVVAGTNCSVDSSDVANPIVNADTQNNAKVTTKGDLEGFNTVAARIPVGTDDQVLTADSTAAEGVAWKDAAGGGGASGSLMELQTHTPSTTAALSAAGRAIKSTFYTALSSFTLESFKAQFDDSLAELKIMICEVSGAANTVDVILFDGAVQAADPTGEKHYRCFAIPQVAIVSGKTIAIVIVRTEGTGTSPVLIGKNLTDFASYPFFTKGSYAQVNGNTVSVGDDLGAGDNVSGFVAWIGIRSTL